MKRVLIFTAFLLSSVICHLSSLQAQVQTESFEGWDGSTQNWLPKGWTEKHTNQTWHVINPDNSTSLPNAYDGKFYVAVGYDKQNGAQDDWLFSPVYETGFYGAMVEYHPAYSPFFLYRVDGSYADWNKMDFKDGERVNSADLQTWVRVIEPDGTPGKWKLMRGLCDQWTKQDFSTLYESFFNTQFHSEKPIDLTAEEYQGANIQIGFRYIGSHGNIIGLDKFSVNSATVSDIVPKNYDTPSGYDEDDDEGGGDDDEKDDTTFVCTEKNLTYNTPGANINYVVDGAYGIIEAKCLFDHSILSTYKGNKITKMHGRIGPECEKVEVMIRPSLYGEPIWMKDITEQYNQNFNTALHYADFTVDVDGVTISGEKSEELWVCYKMYFSYDYDDPGDAPDMYYFTTSGYAPLTLVVQYDEDPNQLADYSGEGPLYCVMETEGDGGLIPRDISVDYMRYCRMPVDEVKSFNMEVTNHGSEEVSSAKFEFIVGEDTYESTINIEPAIKYMETRELEGLLTVEKEGRQELKIRVKGVNNQKDLYHDNNEYKGAVLGLQNAYPRRLLVEESTGTWCGYCPRGTVGIELLKQNFPDNIISTEVHSQDKYADESFWFIPYYYSDNYPAMIVNRFDVLDPFYGTTPANDAEGVPGHVVDDLKFFVDHKSEAQIHVTSAEIDGDKLKVTTSTTFCLDINNAKYALGFVLCEDSVKGIQTNFYSSEQGAYPNRDAVPELLRPYWDMPKYVDTYFDVARLCVGGSGIKDGEIPTTIKRDTPYSYTYEIDIPESVSNRNNLSVIAAVFDVDETNEIVDCERVKISEITGISQVENDSRMSVNGSQLYNLAGQKVGNDYRGVVIRNGKKIIK